MTYPRLDVLWPSGVARTVFPQLGPGVGGNMVSIEPRENGLTRSVIVSTELIKTQAVSSESDTVALFLTYE